jgi:undecaprenyl-diphosphatase
MVSKHIAIAEEQLIRFDDRVHGFFEAYTDFPAVRALDLFSKLADQPELGVIAGGLMVVGTFGGSDRLVRAGARMIIAHEAATLAKDLLKTEIDRTWPRSASNRNDKKPRKGRHTRKEETSFPSGHGVVQWQRLASSPASFRNTGQQPWGPPRLSPLRKFRVARIIRRT